MKLVIMTKSTFFVEEDKILTALFEEGMDSLHSVSYTHLDVYKRQAIRIIDDEVFIYGTPWSGKTPCYRNIKAKLGAITQIDRALTNSVERLSPINAFAILLTSCSGMRWDKDVNNNVCNTVTRIIELTPIYTLHCLPNREAAEICNHAIARK